MQSRGRGRCVCVVVVVEQCWPLRIGRCWVTQPVSQPAVILRNLVMSRSPRLGQDRYDIYNSVELNYDMSTINT